jgi:L-lactate dehydrogenase
MFSAQKEGRTSSDAFKVAIIGCGNVGATTAYALLLDGAITDLTLIDTNREKAEGILLDLEHSLPFTSYVKLNAGSDYALCSEADVVIVTAGKKQAEGETRLELIKANRAIFEDIIPKITKAAPNTILMIVSNPVDVLTYEAQRISGFPANRVFGTGTALDTSRLRFHISEKIQIHPHSIEAYILGEHGDTSFPVYSSANVSGKPLSTFDGFTQEVADECYANTKNAAYRIIHDVGYTCYSIATVARELIRNIFNDSHKVFPLSVNLNGYYGISDVSLSVPCVLGRNGIEEVIQVPLSASEQESLRKSAETLRQYR